MTLVRQRVQSFFPLCGNKLIRLFSRIFPLAVFGVFLRNISYLYLFNFYTGTLQERENKKNISALFAARTLVGTTLLGLGEVIFGILGKVISTEQDLWTRASLSLIALIVAIRWRHV